MRKLGEGPRAEVFLGHGSSDSGTVALKVARGGESATELEALARAEHPHVVRLIDASSGSGRAPCLVLERLERGSLAHLLERRSRLEPGEAVTILAPIATAVDALHASGVAHGGIGARSVLFRGSGAPVLACFGRAALMEAGATAARLAEEPGVIADRRDLAELATLVLDHVVGAETVREWAATAHGEDRFGALLAERLFAFAPAAPVSFAPDAALGFTVSTRVATTAGAHSASAATGRYGLPRELERIVNDAAAKVLPALRSVRKPVWVAAASVLVALVAALVTVAPGRGDAASAPTGAPSASVSATRQTNVPTAEALDDPLAALSSLIAARESCLAALSALCFEDVDQSGSSALDQDVELVRSIGAGGEIPGRAHIASGTPVLVERLGDSALVDLGVPQGTKPASVLIFRTEAGWRIRDYLG